MRVAGTLLDAANEPILLDVARADAAVGKLALAVAARIGEILPRHVRRDQLADDASARNTRRASSSRRWSDSRSPDLARGTARLVLRAAIEQNRRGWLACTA